MSRRRRGRPCLFLTTVAATEPRFLSVVATPTTNSCDIEVVLDIECTLVVTCSSFDGGKLSNEMGPGTDINVDVVTDDINPGEPLTGSTVYSFAVTATEVAAPHRVNTYNGSFTTGDALPTIVVNSTSQTYHSINVNASVGDAASWTFEIGTTLSYEMGVVDSNPAFATDVAATADGLDDSTTYFYRLVVTDAQSNTDHAEGSVTTDVLPAPSFVSGPEVSGFDLGDYEISWVTDVETDSLITWGFGGFCGPFGDGSDSDGTLTTDHHLHAHPSISCTTFYVYVQSTNANGICSTSIEVEI